MSYEIVKRLEQQKNVSLLNQLESFVKVAAKCRGKLHDVFEASFDWKDCVNEKFILQKLDYIHNNPCNGKWNLANHPCDYPHSSAQFYFTGNQGIYEVMSYMMLQDIDLTKPLLT